ncbi:MAG: hypothetical protein IKE24_12000 [Clostridia bacterium]|nr:hypothetical protein [Clostridia bacterium]
MLERDGLSVDILESLSCKSELGLNLKKTLRHISRERMEDELIRVSSWYDSQEILRELALDLRIKSVESGMLKYDRYYPDKEISKTFNDLLGFRSILDSYEEMDELRTNKLFRFADMSSGKANDDGYRGIHVYYQKDNYCYPIEIQYNTYYDRQINNWLHQYVYKQCKVDGIGRLMRNRYEAGLIRSAEEFKEVLKNVLSGL